MDQTVEFLFLSQEEMIEAGVLDMKNCVAVMDRAMRAVSCGTVVMPGREVTPLQGGGLAHLPTKRVRATKPERVRSGEGGRAPLRRPRPTRCLASVLISLQGDDGAGAVLRGRRGRSRLRPERHPACDQRPQLAIRGRAAFRAGTMTSADV